MTYVLIGIGIVLAIWYALYRAGNPSFWKLVSKYPDEAFEWFTKDDCWVVLDPRDPASKRPEPRSAYSGPFFLCVPRLGWRRITIYGRHPKMEESQEAFKRWVEGEDSFDGPLPPASDASPGIHNAGTPRVPADSAEHVPEFLAEDTGDSATGEVVLNLWYVRDEEGIIYSLRAKAYVVDGSDEDKLHFLQERASLDYLTAEPSEVPKRFHLTVGVGRDAKKMPVGHVSMLQLFQESHIGLFEDAIKKIESRFPAQSAIVIPEDPLVCTTPLMQNAHGVIEPRFSGQIRY